jgi:hypothetical protein
MEQGARDKKFDFPFAELEPCEYRLTKGALFPIFSAFRNKVRLNRQTGQAEWIGGFGSVLELWNVSKAELVTQTRDAIKDYGRKPDVVTSVKVV